MLRVAAKGKSSFEKKTAKEASCDDFFAMSVG